MAWHRHTSLTNFTIQQSRSFEGACVPLRLMNCLFPVPDSQPTSYGDRAFPVAALPYGSGTVFRSISHLLRHFLSSALAWRRTSANSVTSNYCCRALEVTLWLSFMDTLIALTYLLTYLLTTIHLHTNLQMFIFTRYRERKVPNLKSGSRDPVHVPLRDNSSFVG